MKKIVLVNILVLFLLLCSIELFISVKNEFKTPVDYQFYDVPVNSLPRPVYGLEYKNRPIILFGCSIAYGYNLHENGNFSAILSKLTQRPVYNAARTGYGPAHMLSLLKQNKVLFNINNPEYIIYTYIKDHKNRLFYHQGGKNSSQLYLRYVLDKNGVLQQVKKEYPFYWRFQTTKHIQYAIEKLHYSNENKVNDLMYKVFSDSVEVMKTRYPDAKLVMLLYNQALCGKNNSNNIFRTEEVLSEKEQEMFKSLGFKIYNIEEISGQSFCGEQYHSQIMNSEFIDPYHPSTQMWEEFVPKLIEKLQM